jgi:PIN domain nuclease of toxin-antitoxin system
MIYLDTHVVVWLYAGDLSRFPAAIQDLLESEELVICPMVAIELQYLYETQRLSEPSSVVVDDLGDRIGLKLSDTPFPTIARAAVKLSWTRDPFDHIIAAHAVADQVRLITADKTILSNIDLAVWD